MQSFDEENNNFLPVWGGAAVLKGTMRARAGIKVGVRVISNLLQLHTAPVPRDLPQGRLAWANSKRAHLPRRKLERSLTTGAMTFDVFDCFFAGPRSPVKVAHPVFTVIDV